MSRYGRYICGCFKAIDQIPNAGVSLQIPLLRKYVNFMRTERKNSDLCLGMIMASYLIAECTPLHAIS